LSPISNRGEISDGALTFGAIDVEKAVVDKLETNRARGWEARSAT
jgi:hypothetical protein